MSELRECPFCGVPPSLNPVASGKPSQYTVECNNGRCPAQPFVVEIGEGRAITAWNTRPASRVEEAAREIGEAMRRVGAILHGTGDANYVNVTIRAGACREFLAALAPEGDNA